MIYSVVNSRTLNFSIFLSLLIVLIIGFSSCSKKLYYGSVDTEKACLCKSDALWHQSKCWKKAAQTGGLSKQKIDSVAQAQIDNWKNTAITFNGESYPVKVFFPFPSGKDMMILVGFDYKESIHYLMSIVPAKKLNKGSHTDNMALIKGDILSRENDSIPLASGTATFSVLDTDQFVLGMNGTLIDSNTQASLSFSLEASEDLVGIGTSHLEIKGNEAFLSGELGTLTYFQIKDLIENHPEVKTIVMGQINGSVNDAVNMHTGRLVCESGLTTKLLANSEIASGGVDLFCAGRERIIENGARVGIHSWCCFGDLTAIELPREHPAHLHQLEYFTMALGEEMGPAFYFHTLEAAPFDGVHWMTNDELKKWNISTQTITN